jgi:hypothetical protein
MLVCRNEQELAGQEEIYLFVIDLFCAVSGSETKKADIKWRVQVVMQYVTEWTQFEFYPLNIREC